VLIAEELVLIALDPAKGTVHLATRSELHRAVTLALASELAIGGRLSYEDKKLDVVPGEPPADPLLAEALAAITERLEQGRKPMRVLGSLDKDLGGVWARLIDRLVAAGTIVEEHHGVLPARHPVSARHAEVLSRVQAAAAADGPLDPRDAVLLAYGLLCALVDRVAPERSHRRHTIARMEEAMKVAPFAGILRKMTEVTPQFAPVV
jgi:Golgi phosphoprotein 3 (GPP34)